MRTIEIEVPEENSSKPSIVEEVITNEEILDRIDKAQTKICNDALTEIGKQKPTKKKTKKTKKKVTKKVVKSMIEDATLGE